MAEYLYKYRSLEDLERFFSIIIDKKLYGALFNEMNDPMEGYYKYDPQVDKSVYEAIVHGKLSHYICSLSKRGDIGLMWTHYGNQNKGCCLEVEVTSKTWTRVDVNYSESMPEINEDTTVEDILSVKAKVWEYEKEVRYLSPESNIKKRPRLSVRVNRILLGCNVSRAQETHLRKIIKAINYSIIVEKMTKEKLDYGFIKNPVSIV